MIWAGIGRVTHQAAGTASGELDAYQRALAEEMDDGSPSQAGEVEFEGSRKLGDDWACAMPSALVSSSASGQVRGKNARGWLMYRFSFRTVSFLRR